VPTALREPKSLAISGLLSLVLGPFGWLYAAPVSHAIGGILALMLASAVLPHGWMTAARRGLSCLRPRRRLLRLAAQHGPAMNRGTLDGLVPR